MLVATVLSNPKFIKKEMRKTKRGETKTKLKYIILS